MCKKNLLQQIQKRVQDPETRTDMSNVLTPELFPPVSLQELECVEEKLSFTLPRILRRLYLEIGNGGFGPGYGLIGAQGGHLDDEGRSLLEIYKFMSSTLDLKGVVPICEWGSGVWSCVDCISQAGSIVTLHEKGLTRTPHDLATWLATWVNGGSLWDQMFEFKMVDMENPFTGQMKSSKVRGAPKGAPLEG